MNSNSFTIYKWLAILFILMIPVLGIVYAFILIFNKKSNQSFINFLWAFLIIYSILSVLHIVVFIPWT